MNPAALSRRRGGLRLLALCACLCVAPAAGLADEIDAITLSCFGGVTGGGRMTTIRADGTIERADCTGPGAGRCAPSRTLGHDVAAFRHWAGALAEAHFDELDAAGGFGEGSCSLAIRQGRSTHASDFQGLPNDPRGVPAPVARVIRELGLWHNQ